MRELDVLLDTYLEQHGAAMTPPEMHTFERFLESTDMDLYAWVTRRARPADGEFATLVDGILELRPDAS